VNSSRGCFLAYRRDVVVHNLCTVLVRHCPVSVVRATGAFLGRTRLGRPASRARARAAATAS